MVENPDAIDDMLLPLTAEAGDGMMVQTWKQRNLTFFNALAVERNVMFLVLTMIILVAALNIISGLIMLVKDKGRDIAILRTMGATRGLDPAGVLPDRCGDRRRGHVRRFHRRAC